MSGGKSPQGEPLPVRYHLEDTRDSVTVKFVVYGQDRTVDGYFTVGLYDDGTPGELFIDMDKEGNEVHGWADCWAVAISMLLQYGVDPRKIYEKFSFQQFEPSGITSLSQVPMCKSVVDMIIKFMKQKFPPTAEANKESDGYENMITAVTEDSSKE